MEFFREYYWLTCGLATLLLGLSIILTGRWHGSFTTDHMHGVQKFHVSPTPRIGGVAILGGTWVGYLLSPELSKIVFLPILLASLPTFMFGLADDLTKRITPAWRMVATMVSALLAWYLTDVALSLVGVPLLTPLFAPLWVAVPFTVFAVSGLVNSVNIIDGFNGLAGSTLVYLLLGTGYLAEQMGDPALADVAMLLAAAVVGFLVLNWPFGKIFLGDGGAYFCGFVLAWLCILLMERNPGVDPFSILLLCLYPITEVLFSIYRRRAREHHVSKADRLHLHSLVKLRCVRKWNAMRPLPTYMRNSVTGVLVGLLNLPAVLAAIVLAGNQGLTIAAMVVYVLLYITLYARLVSFRWISPFRFLTVKV